MRSLCFRIMCWIWCMSIIIYLSMINNRGNLWLLITWYVIYTYTDFLSSYVFTGSQSFQRLITDSSLWTPECSSPSSWNYYFQLEIWILIDNSIKICSVKIYIIISILLIICHTYKVGRYLDFNYYLKEFYTKRKTKR